MDGHEYKGQKDMYDVLLVDDRGGARVCTTISSLSPGDIVHLEEVGGPFKTRAEVRGSYVGKDNIRRLLAGREGRIGGTKDHQNAS